MPQRRCGDCTLCCKLLPVVELKKADGVRCLHQRRTGCRVYRKRGMPASCAMWSCLWLTGAGTADLSRPDRSHCVIDIMPDFVEVMDNVTGERQRIDVVVIWVDPAHPDAWRAPEMMRFIEQQAGRGRAAMIRFSSNEARAVFAPVFNVTGEWHITERQASTGGTHTVEEIFGGKVGHTTLALQRS